MPRPRRYFDSGLGDDMTDLDLSTLFNSGTVSPDLFGTVTPQNTDASTFVNTLNAIGKIAGPVANAYSTANNAATLNRQIAAFPAASSNPFSSLTASPYFPYVIGGGFILLALSVLGGSSSKRR